jgi:hypothetical protein
MDTILTKLQERRIGERNGSVSVVIVYEDFATRARANEFCEGLSRELSRGELVKQAWLLSLLRLPQLRTIAAQDAASADILLVSLHDGANLAEEVKAWLEQWLQQKGNRPSLLLALVDTINRDDYRALPNYLQTVARRGGVEFLVRFWDSAG